MVYEPTIEFAEKVEAGVSKKLYEKIYAETKLLYTESGRVECETKGNLAMSISQVGQIFEDIDYVCVERNHLDGLTKAKLHFAMEK